jgi:acetyl-CoA synthetase
MIREGNDGVSKMSITYSQLRREVCKVANAFKGLGIKKGDRIAMYMSVSIDLVVAMLACARIGAIHTVVVSFMMSIHFQKFNHKIKYERSDF